MPVKIYSYAKDRDTMLSKHFAVYEFRAKRGSALDGDDILIATELINKLEILSDLVNNKPVVITDGYRTPEYDLLLTGKQGQHTKGNAADIKISGFDSKTLAAYAQAAGFDGIGIINGYAVHVDVRGYKSYFIENGIAASNVTKVETFLSHEHYLKLVQNHFKLADNTMEYLNQYTWNRELFKKLWDGVKTEEVYNG